MQDRGMELSAVDNSQSTYSAAVLTSLDGNSQSTYSVTVLTSYADIFLLLLVGFAGVIDGLRIILTKTDAVGNASAGGWIVLLGGLLIAGTCGYAVKKIRAGPSTSTPDTDDQTRQPIIALAMLLIYIVLIDPLGYTLATALFMAIYLHIFGKYGVLKVVTISITFALGSSWLWAAMDMMLPQGPFPWP